MKKLQVLAAGALAGLWGMAANATVIDFDTVLPGDVGVTITDTVGGGGCVVQDFGVQSDGLACGILNDTDGSKAQIDLGTTANTIALDYGNDDPGFTLEGDLAIIELWLGGAFVDAVTQVMNRDDVMNQTIAFAGANFDQAFFYYGAALGVPFTGGGTANVGLIEIFDNITFAQVPEPGTLSLLGLGLVGFGLSKWRRARV